MPSAADAAPRRKSRPSLADYRAMAAFRYQLRRFLAFSVREAEAAGVPAQQYQALLAIKGWTGAAPLSITELADQLFIRQHTAGELVKRMEASGLVSRRLAQEDHRRAELSMTEKADELLARLASVHLAELKANGPTMAGLLALMDRDADD